MPGSGIVILGRVAGPCGLKGWVRIQAFGDDPLSWRAMPHWQLAPAESGEWQSFSLVDFRAQGKSLIARFAQIDDRTAAEAIKGWWIGASRETLPPLTDDEFYWNDLIGLTVENEAGEILGEITALIETGANDVLRVIGQDETERLIPFVDAVVKAVDLSRQRVRVAWETDW